MPAESFEAARSLCEVKRSRHVVVQRETCHHRVRGRDCSRELWGMTRCSTGPPRSPGVCMARMLPGSRNKRRLLVAAVSWRTLLLASMLLVLPPFCASTDIRKQSCCAGARTRTASLAPLHFYSYSVMHASLFIQCDAFLFIQCIFIHTV